MYRKNLEEGETPNVDDYELAEDYIENNLEEHRKRVAKFWCNVVYYWSRGVECLYPDGTGIATETMAKAETEAEEGRVALSLLLD